MSSLTPTGRTQSLIIETWTRGSPDAYRGSFGDSPRRRACSINCESGPPLTAYLKEATGWVVPARDTFFIASFLLLDEFTAASLHLHDSVRFCSDVRQLFSVGASVGGRARVECAAVCVHKTTGTAHVAIPTLPWFPK